jgi:hypothetical protein
VVRSDDLSSGQNRFCPERFRGGERALPTKEFFDYLSPEDRLRYRIVTANGQVFDFVVQYEVRIDERFWPVVRYDASHGHGHRDTLDSNGKTLRKDWLPAHMNLKDCLSYAAIDLRVNWKQYRLQFLEML